MKEKKYSLYYYSKLGTQRKPSVRWLLFDQKDKLIFDFRKQRETSRKNCCVIYFTDISKYAVICATLIRNTDTSVAVVILDDEKLVKDLEIEKKTECKNASVDLKSHYTKKEFVLPPELTLERVNKVRKQIKESSPSHSYLKQLESLPEKQVFEYVILPVERLCKHA